MNPQTNLESIRLLNVFSAIGIVSQNGLGLKKRNKTQKNKKSWNIVKLHFTRPFYELRQSRNLVKIRGALCISDAGFNERASRWLLAFYGIAHYILFYFYFIIIYPHSHF